MQRGIVWVVDDDSSIRWVLERALAGAGLTCTTFENGAEVLEALASKTPDVLLSDIRMPGMDGLALLKQIKQRHPMLPVIIMTAHSDLDAAVSAYQQGAFDYLPKPFDIDEAVALVERAISHYQEQQQPRNVQLNGPTTDIIGEAPAMQDVFRIIGRLSRSSISVLINGESGTGKELVAHALHRQKAVLAPLQQFPRRIAGQHTVLTTNIPENGIHRNELYKVSKSTAFQRTKQADRASPPQLLLYVPQAARATFPTPKRTV